ncbi:MAG: relaxase/mobilization nuclease domain-containing protein [Rhodobacteraceae bacterium]|nr:relaxase/mobilization nuclease domain-containing protein [Paracoccaceae bacterium]
MNELRDVTIRLPEPLIASALRLAEQRRSTLGKIIHDILSLEIESSTRVAKTSNRADEQLLAPLRVLLASDFALAKNWQCLNRRLRIKGYDLREAGGGLALHSHPGGRRLCKASELGHAYIPLMRRFQAPFPGHSHRYLVDKVLGPAWPPEEMDQQFSVIEPF